MMQAQATAPVADFSAFWLPDGGQILAGLDAFGAEGADKPRFLRAADATQQALYQEFLLTYGNDAYAKLLALKAVNLAVAKYHFTHRHTHLASRPLQVMIDPANGCQLQCPGCVHTSNKEWSDRFHWPRNMLSVPKYEQMLSETGPYALSATLYNYGEPLLNKSLPQLIQRARQFLLFTWISSNLSLKFDTESLVRSGLDYAILSCDGVTQEVYGRYRRRGDINLVLDNMRALVAAKRRLGLTRPYLVWQYLTFEHNLHEVDAAIEMAREIGVDRIMIATPFDVSLDDPDIKVATSPRQGDISFIPWEDCRERAEAALAEFDGDPVIDAAFQQSWLNRIQEQGGLDEPNRVSAGTCRWLYENLTLDGAGRLMPCCMSPTFERKLVFGNLDDQPADLFNLPDLTASRLAFADRAAYDAAMAPIAAADRPYCGDCTERSNPMYGADHSAMDLSRLDFVRRVRWRTWQALAKWQ